MAKRSNKLTKTIIPLIIYYTLQQGITDNLLILFLVTLRLVFITFIIILCVIIILAIILKNE